LQWKEYQKNPDTEPEMPQPPKPEEVIVEVCKDWVWLSRYERWMDIEGNHVRLSSLPLDQFVCSAVAIRKANYARITSRVKWTEMLVLPKTPIPYPTAELEVGYQEAGIKLDEFKEEAAERGLL
jgi:hypothetical protein